MVTKIKFSRSINRALNYNEQKMQKGDAELIHASGFILEGHEMNFYQKLERFKDQLALNQRSQVNAVHISINFHEKDALDKDKLKEITQDYMKQIGFEKQPYLVYQHRDAGHTHVHVVTINIREDGSRIPTHNLPEKISEPARKALELKYGLVIAQGREQKPELVLKKEYSTKVAYGKSETVRSINNVLDHVVENYNYTSLAELNAILSQFNVKADPGAPGGRIQKNGGLTYRILDDQGNPVGVPVKASLIYSKPTLKKLKEQFAKNELKRKRAQVKVRSKLDKVFEIKYNSLEELQKALEKQRVALVIRRGKDNRIYGLTYVDHENKAVFNGSDLGKVYSAQRVLEMIGDQQEKRTQVLSKKPEHVATKTPQRQDENIKPSDNKIPSESFPKQPFDHSFSTSIVERLFMTEYTNEFVPGELSQQQRKKRKRQRNRFNR